MILCEARLSSRGMLYWWLGRRTWWIKGGRLYSIHGCNTSFRTSRVSTWTSSYFENGRYVTLDLFMPTPPEAPHSERLMKLDDVTSTSKSKSQNCVFMIGRTKMHTLLSVHRKKVVRDYILSWRSCRDVLWCHVHSQRGIKISMWKKLCVILSHI